MALGRLEWSDKTKKPNFGLPKKIDIDELGIVVDVITDDTHPRLESLDDDVEEIKDTFSNGINTLPVGSVVVRPLGQGIKTKKELPIYRPYDSFILTLPIIGEMVQLIPTNFNKRYKRIYSNNLNLGNALPNRDNLMFGGRMDENSGRGYREQSESGITNSSDVEEGASEFGNYFSFNPINRLKFYEGDTLLQSRFGQSIRFSAYNNVDNEFSPNIIIRNRQNTINDVKLFDVIEEDINRDGSIIALTSNKYKLNFRPGKINQNNKTDFKTEPKFFKLPEEYTGKDQIFINSERLILSSKSDETIIFSKGNYGFISDGRFYIENGMDGADLNFNGGVNIYTNENDFTIDGGDGGRIFLNTTETTEPLVRGETLKGLLERLLDLISDMTFATPSGPTAQGPINKVEFLKLKRELRDILSEQNFTQ
jgi:hypothetical protein